MEIKKDLKLCPMTPEHIRIREVLIRYARKNDMIVYLDLLNQAKVRLDMSIPYDRGVLGHLLGEISWNEVQEGRPMLSSVARLKDKYIQGQGFFDLAEKLYDVKLNNSDKKRLFGIEELKKTYEYWYKS